VSFLPPVLHCVKRKFGYLQNKGTSVWNFVLNLDKKLSYRRGTARCVVSVDILPTATQQCRNYLYDKIVL